MKIAILADIAVDAVGGMSDGRGGGHSCTWLPQLADEFAAHYKDCEIIWITIRHRIKKRITKEINGQLFIMLPGFNPRIDALTGNWFSRRTLSRELSKLQPDLIHVWGTEKPYAAALAVFNGPKLLSIQGFLTAFAKVAPLPSHLRVATWLELGRIRRADRVTCESPWSAEQVHAFAKTSMPDVVDYGVHPRFYASKWQPNLVSPYLVFSGSLDHRKGFDLLMEAIQQIPDRDWSLVILGHGPLRERYQRLNLKDVEFVGSLPWQKMIPVMEKACGLIVPTRADTGPSVVKEARVIGLPVIASNHGGLRDYIQDSVNGIKVEPLEADKLAQSLVSFMANQDKIIELGRLTLEDDRDRFLPTHTARKFHAIYREMHTSLR